jgi:hypothetical protein
MKLPELKNEIVSILRERSTYKLGTQEYTKKNLTPTDILELAMAYSQVQGKGTTMYGRKMDKMIAVANDLAKLNGTTQQDAKKRGDKPALILTLLKNKLVTKDEYITLYKDLLLKQTSVVKNLKNADPASRMVGGAAARAAHKDMKSESVVNERYSDFIKAKNLTDIVALSKKKKNATFYVTDDNNSRIGTFYLKNGKFAKATGGNANYDLQNSKTKLKDRSDVIYKYKIDESVVNEMAMGFDTMTGLFYLKGVPFTKERIKEVVLFMKSSKPKTSSNQFEMTSALIIKDKVNKGEVTIDSKNLKTLIEAFKRYKNLASDKDFN